MMAVDRTRRNAAREDTQLRHPHVAPWLTVFPVLEGR